VKIQSFGNYHWCVDSSGEEVAGTRIPGGPIPDCNSTFFLIRKKLALFSIEKWLAVAV